MFKLYILVAKIFVLTFIFISQSLIEFQAWRPAFVYISFQCNIGFKNAVVQLISLLKLEQNWKWDIGHVMRKGFIEYCTYPIYNVFKHLITKTCLYNFYPLKPHFYIVKLGFTGVYIIFLISAQKHRLWVLVRTASPRRF